MKPMFDLTIRQMTAEAWADQINQQTAKTVASIIATGRLLIVAKAANPGEFLRLFSERLIKVDYKHAQRLMRVARHPVLSDWTHLSNLPASWTVLLQLSQMSEEIVRSALADGRITPTITQRQARSLKPTAVVPDATAPPPSTKLDKTAAGTAARLGRIRDLAHDGYSAHQISAEVRMHPTHVMKLIHDHAIDYPAGRATSKSQRRIDSNKFVERIATDAENMMAHLDLIDYSNLDGARLDEWIASLKTASAALTGLIRQLTRERDRYVATDETQGGQVESQARANCADAGTSGAGGAAEI